MKATSRQIARVSAFVAEQFKDAPFDFKGIEDEAEYSVIREDKYSTFYMILWTDGCTHVMIVKEDKDGMTIKVNQNID